MHIPLNVAGILMLPPISEPRPNGEEYEPTNPPSPPELPPVDRLVFHGFLAYPKILLFVYIVLHA